MASVVLRLYLSGQSSRSQTALANLRRLLAGADGIACELEVVDILEQPELAEEQSLLATPTLIKMAPPPMRRVIGDLSDLQAVGDALGLSQDPSLGRGDRG